MANAAIDPNPTKEFIFGDLFVNAFRPSKSRSAIKACFYMSISLIYMSLYLINGNQSIRSMYV